MIVTGLYQGREKIKTRDFHNLMGRAGRSGMYTEGSILFAHPFIYDRKRVRGENWRWNEAKNLLEASNSEPCTSNLLSLFDAFHSEDGKERLSMKPLSFIRAYISNPDSMKTLSRRISTTYSNKGFTQISIESQVRWKMDVISAVESFLMSKWEEEQAEMAEPKVVSLAQSTLAYFMADTTTRENIVELFKILAKNISDKVTDAGLRKIYGRTMYGMLSAQEIEKWVSENSLAIFLAHDEGLLDTLWPLFSQYVRCSAFQKCNKPEMLLQVAKKWVSGESFVAIQKFLHDNEVQLQRGSRESTYKIDNVVELCESGLSYDGTLLLSAITEFFVFHEDEELAEAPTQVLEFMQKKMKYGLPSMEAVLFYELGFSDRIIAQELALHMSDVTNQREAKWALGTNLASVQDILSKYPSYFQSVLDNLLV